MTWIRVLAIACLCAGSGWLCRRRPAFLRSVLAGAAVLAVFRWFTRTSVILYAVLCLAVTGLSFLPGPEKRKERPWLRRLCALLRALVVAAMVPLAIRAAIDTAAARGLHAIFYFGLAGAFGLLAAAMLFRDAIGARIGRYLSPKLLTVLTLATPFICFFLEEYSWSLYIPSMQIRFFAENIILISAVYIMALAILPSRRLAIGLSWLVCVSFGTANYYLSLFRDNPLMPGDFYSLLTAAAVVRGYDFLLSARMMICWLIVAFGWFILPLLPDPVAEEKWLPKRPAGRLALFVLAAFLASGYVANVDYAEKFDIEVQKWKVTAEFYSYGSAVYFATLVHEARHVIPEDYSLEAADQALEQYAQTAQEEQEEKKPTIIAIMNESFADLHCLGDFETSLPCLEHYYDRTDLIRHGNLYVSIYGGGTADSEFEFLTGNSMAFMPVGSVPYQDYDMENVGNLAAILKDRGYITTAIHPENKSNWNRERNYAKFGFDSFLSYTDFAEDSQRFRNHISDRASYAKVIEAFEANRGKPQFIFNVTMQNHGGYFTAADEFTNGSIYNEDLEKVFLTGKNSQYNEVNNYLSLVRESDKALYEFLRYFESVDEPVVICFFGDHEPTTPVEWRESVMGCADESLPLQEAQKKYMVPYFIWANYDTGAESRELDMSPNYLGGQLLEVAGLQDSAYTAYLQDLRESIPAINALGYMDTQGIWHQLNSETELSALLKEYDMVQYNALFDEKRNMAYYR